MASDNNQPITFVVPGRRQASGATRGGVGAAAASGAAPAAGVPGRVKASVQVGSLRSGGAPERLVAVPGEDVVALHIAGGPVLYLHPATARDLMLAQGNTSRGAPAAGAAAAATEVAVPVQLRWAGLEQAAPARTRGFLGEVALSTLEVLTGFVKDQAVLLVAGEIVKRADAQVDAGVYALAPDALTALKGSGRKLAQLPASSEPLLVLVHGTFTDSASTFIKLWQQHPQRVRELFAHYGGRVYALDHPTMGASPVANALTLVRALPKGARLHLVTHSRGGLVAEVLARVASQRSIVAADLAFFPSSTHADARRQLQELAAAVRTKGISVERVVRVACPARGTLLASGRLDAYLSVLKWTLDLAGVPVAPTLMDFICEVARRRADPVQIPGIEAMMPGTPLLNWLNAAPAGIAGDLRVVAGDLEGDSVGSWLKTLLADGYYWTDNDIVVQTRSMYGGAPRLGGASFLLDRGGKVSHFAYFSNPRTADAIVDALVQAQPPAGFRPIGLLSWQGQDSGGERGGGGGPAPGSDGARPAVFVLPGIMGSNLAVAGDRVWLSLRLLGGLSRIQYRPGAEDVTPDGAIGAIYGELIKYLAASHDVVEFGFDWRRPIEEEARRLATAVDQALAARQASGQPVRILAHSMGGLLARTMWLERPATWQRLMAHPEARLLMLGTPNGGSWAPMQVLSGDDTLGNTLAALGSPLADHAARELMAGLPGLLQLQAGLTDPALGLDKAATWARLADDDLQQTRQRNWWHNSAGEAQEAAYRWGVPAQAVLDQALALRRRLDAQLNEDFKTWAGRILLVVGAARFTPDGFEIGAQGFVYRNAVDGGDGRVPLASALLPDVATWKLACDHSELPSEKRAFEAYVELLTQGSTAQLETLAATRGGPAAAAAVVHVRARPARQRPSARPAESERDVLGLAGDEGDGSEGGTDVRAPAEMPLRLAVLNGNLTFVRQPLVIGHYRSLMLTGTEDVIDRHIGGAMHVALAAGLYPELPGSSRVFVNTRRRPDDPFHPPRPQAAIVVGLGEEGNLSTQQLTTTVRQGCIAWAQRAAEIAANEGREAGAPAAEIEIAATLLGSGGLGITAGSAARAIAQGVHEANQRLAGSGWPRIGQLTLVELYLDRAADAWRGLQMLATACPKLYRVQPTIAAGTGALRRQMDSGYRGTGYDLISATSGADGSSIAFALDTHRARTEVRAQSTQRKLLTDLVRQAATANLSDPQIGRTLFQLLVPAELEPFMAGEDSVVLELDSGTAPIPWELLEAGAVPLAGSVAADDPRARPWAIRTRLLRRLRKANFRPAPQDANADDAVLVIGEPFIEDDQGYPRLPGARAEAEAVAARLTAMGGLPAERVSAFFDQPDAATVINALLARRYRIVHIAGHGEPVERDAAGKPVRTRGVVLSGGVFLGAVEIKAMRTVPELVFVNCCHLGGHDASEALHDDDPGAFAATVADSLIEIGVRCVVAAGWAVGDQAAEAFATTFYRELLQQSPFIDAVHAAREAAWQAEPGGKTWAAYQCYGDPNWVLSSRVGDAQAASAAPRDTAITIASPPGLALALEEIATKLRYMGADGPTQRQVLQTLEQRFAAEWGGIGAVAEAFAVAWAAANGRDEAIAWYERALQAEDASASIKVQEQLGNLRVRAAWAMGREARPGTAAFDGACAAIERARDGLQALAAAQPTVERLSLVGSAAKRLALLHARGKDAEARQRERQAAHAAYADAEALARARTPARLFYPGLNRIAAELVLLGRGHALAADASEEVRQSLLRASAADPDFWTEAARIEFEWLHAVAEQRLAASLAAVRGAFIELHLRVDARGSWESVSDQAEFVLVAYRAGAVGDERAAADALIELLAGYAG